MKPASMACWRISRTLTGAVLTVLLLAASLPARAAAAAGTVHVVRAEMQVRNGIPLGETLDERLLDGPWRTVDLPHAFVAGGGDGAGGVVTTWYRIRPEDLADLAGSAGAKDLYLVRWTTPGWLAVYADGRLVYRSPGTPAWHMFRRPALLLPLTRTDAAPLPGNLLIRMDTLARERGALSSLYIGDAATLGRRHALRDWLEYQFPFLCNTVLVAIGVFTLGIWLARRRDSLYLLFFLAALCSLAWRWHFYVGTERLPIPDRWFAWLALGALTWQITIFHFIARHLHGRFHPWLDRGLVGLALLLTVAAPPVFALDFEQVRLRILASNLTMTLVAAVALHDVWRSRTRDAWLFAVCIALIPVFSFTDWLRTSHILDMEGWYLGPLGVTSLLAILAWILFRRYVGAMDEVELSNANLERRLKEREAELAASHQRLRRIEQREILGRERQRLMQDMHDGLGSSLRTALWAVEKGQLDEDAVAEVLKDCIDDLKLAIDSMEPVDADLLLLLAALRYRLGNRLASSGIALDWRVQDVPALDWLGPSSSLHILRILQEAFTNIIKHTRATKILVTTGMEGDGVVVAIADDGPGFDPERALAGGGKGLANQRRRAAAIGAEILWASGPQGTTLRLWLPLRAGAG